MNFRNFLVMLLAIVLAVAYAYFGSEKTPEKGLTATPKEYMEMVEKDPAAAAEKQDPVAESRP